MSSELIEETMVQPSGCPVPHVAAVATTCPFPHDAGARPAPQRSRADEFVRKVLRIEELPADASEATTMRTFQRSMLISAIRCTLTYVVFPFVLPAVSFAKGVGPVLGITIGVVAMTCDVFTVRRFFAVDHKWRWHFSAIAGSVIVLLSILLVQDVAHLVEHGI